MINMRQGCGDKFALARTTGGYYPGSRPVNGNMLNASEMQSGLRHFQVDQFRNCETAILAAAVYEMEK